MTPEASMNFMESVLDMYVRPEMQRRMTDGVGLNEALWAAQIVFQNDNLPPLVRLNSEVRLLTKTEASDEWLDYALLQQQGRVPAGECTLVPEESGIRHITMYQVGEGDAWQILFDAIGNQVLVNDAPGLGTVISSPNAGAPPLEKLSARVDQLFGAIERCLEDEYFESAMILVYSGIDAFAWLNRPDNIDDVRRLDFEEWLNTYFLPGSGFTCTASDLYGARCGLVHSNTGESRLNRQDRAHKVFYYRERENEKSGIIQILMDERLPPWFIDVDQFVGALRIAVERFIAVVTADEPKLELVSQRITVFYFSNGEILGRAER